MKPTAADRRRDAKRAATRAEFSLDEIQKDLDAKLAKIERDHGLLPGILDTVLNLFREEVGYTPQEVLGQAPYRAPEPEPEPGEETQDPLVVGNLKALLVVENERLKALLGEAGGGLLERALAEVDKLERENQLLGDKLEEFVKQERVA